MRIIAQHFVCGDVLIGYIMPRQRVYLIRPTNNTEYASEPYVFTFIAHRQCTRVEGLRGWQRVFLLDDDHSTIFYSYEIELMQDAPKLGYELISRVNV